MVGSPIWVEALEKLEDIYAYALEKARDSEELKGKSLEYLDVFKDVLDMYKSKEGYDPNLIRFTTIPPTKYKRRNKNKIKN